MHIYNNDIICHCGKQVAWKRKHQARHCCARWKRLWKRWNIRAVRQGEEPASGTHPAGYPRRHPKEDVLSIETLQKVAVELGTNLAGIINIFNPEMLVIGGDLSVTGAYLTQPICMGIKSSRSIWWTRIRRLPPLPWKSMQDWLEPASWQEASTWTINRLRIHY